MDDRRDVAGELGPAVSPAVGIPVVEKKGLPCDREKWRLPGMWSPRPPVFVRVHEK